MRVMKALGVSALLGLVALGSPLATTHAVAQTTTCLHGDDESPAQLARRRQALGFARHVGTKEAAAASTIGAGAYQPAERLGLTEALPSGFQLHLSASGSSYAYSVIDTSDPCKFGYFSNEIGIIYRGEAIRGGRS